MKTTYSKKRTLQPFGFTVDRLNSELAALRAENEKLRAALQRIRCDEPNGDKFALIAIAKAAIAKEGK